MNPSHSEIFGNIFFHVIHLSVVKSLGFLQLLNEDVLFLHNSIALLLTVIYIIYG